MPISTIDQATGVVVDINSMVHHVDDISDLPSLPAKSGDVAIIGNNPADSYMLIGRDPGYFSDWTPIHPPNGDVITPVTSEMIMAGSLSQKHTLEINHGIECEVYYRNKEGKRIKIFDSGLTEKTEQAIASGVYDDDKDVI